MKLFQCQHCAQVLYFENTLCEKCGRNLGYLPEHGSLSALEPDGAAWVALADPDPRYRFCANWERRACNWMVAAEAEEAHCLACRHNRVIPDLSDPDRVRRWRLIEEAKRRLFYTLLKLDLPIPAPGGGEAEPLVFDFLADPPADGQGPRVLTGHDSGVITLSITEADDADRAQIRSAMGEPYRTLLGHFRHEVGHYYWDRLIRDAERTEEFRAVFGDESIDYGEALTRHHENGAPAGWQQDFVSAYATTHPWEDWAETWAHYFHILDTLETAGAFGIRISPEVAEATGLETASEADPHRVHRIGTLIEAWLPLTYAVNCLNRSMGQQDLYPFVLSPRAIEKLGFVHDLVRKRR